MHLPDGFLYGRVIDTNANALGGGGSVLIYIYKARSNVREDIPELHLDQLLIPPLMTNKLPWSRGYFQFLENRPLEDKDRLKQHCFVNTEGWYFDEQRNRLPKAHEPVGQWGLHSFRTIDDEISKALGIPLVPD